MFKEANQDLQILAVNDSFQLFQVLKEETQRPSLLILDLNIPLVDGFEILRKLKADEHLRVIPVIVITTSEVEADVQQAYQLGANAFITKPDRYTDFQQTVASLSQFWLQTVRLP